MTHSFPPRRSSDLGISTAGISAARIGRPHGTARLVAGDDRIEAVGLARIKELVSRQGHPVLLARGPELGHRLQPAGVVERAGLQRSEEHTSELQSLMRISYAVFCLKKKKSNT